MSTDQILYGDSLKDAARPWLDELGKSDKDRLKVLLDLSITEKIRLSDCLEKLYPSSDTQRALADLTRLRSRVNEVAEEAKLELRLHVDSKKKNPPNERECWFTGPDMRERLGSIASAASIRNLDRLPALISEQTCFVYNPFVSEQTKELDFAIVVPLQEEFDQVYGSIVPAGDAILVGSDSAYVFSWQGYKGCIAFVGEMGPQAMADLTRSILERFKPRLVALIGIAGGMDTGLRLGDVLVADAADEYLRTSKASATADEDYEFNLSGEVFKTTHHCVKTLKSWQYGSPLDYAKWQKEGQAEYASSTFPEDLRASIAMEPAIKAGHLATGDVVGTAPAFIKMLKRRDRKFAALDMEATGMLSAVHKHAPQTQTVVLRGISDFADERKTAFDQIGSGQFRQAAMRNAARLFLAALPRCLSPRGQTDEPEDDMVPPDLRTHQAQDRMTVVPEAYQPNDGCPVGLNELATVGDIENRQGRVPAADYILEWIKTGDSPFLAVLGEYGIGKTTTLKYVTRSLLDERDQDPSIPLPIFIDLRENYLPLKPDGTLPTLEQIINESIRRNWKLEEKETLTATDVLHLVRQKGAVIIFDGLDEKIVHMDHKQAQGFIRELWKALPPFDVKPPQRGKLILSCRSHYFPTITAQNSLLRGEDREGIRDEDYRACLILPFTPEQTQAYLCSSLGEVEGHHAWEVITSIHNLQEVTARPYLLSLVTPQIERLEKRRARGETVTAITLYDDFVEQWLERDAGKHKFSQAHKRELMENLAAALWQDGVKEWSWSRVESWLEEFYAARPVWQARYAARCDFELLLEDVRTATFIVRPETSPESFRFAHTSLQEYFLAGHLVRALKNKKEDEWDLPMVSLETLGFLGQMLTVDPQRIAALNTIDCLLEGNCLRAAVLAFKYWLEGIRHGYPQPAPEHVVLRGADLSEWHIKGLDKHNLLNLKCADLRGVKLKQSRIEFVDISKANLENAEASQALLLEVIADQANFSGCIVSGLNWRRGSICDSNINLLQLAEMELIHVGMDREKTPNYPKEFSESAKKIQIFVGHSSGVLNADLNHDETRLVSSAEESFMIVWDVLTARQLFYIFGHEDQVNCCCWSPDGLRILSGSSDKTLRIWHADSGEEQLKICGHEAKINSCHWHPNGNKLMSVSDDSTLRIWCALTGQEQLRINKGSVKFEKCEWSPCGNYILSAGSDLILDILDASTGDSISSIKIDFGTYLNDFHWSPDSTMILTGTSGGYICIWNAFSGILVRKWKNHCHITNVTNWSSNGNYIASTLNNKNIAIWDARSGKLIKTITHERYAIHVCAWLNNDSKLIIGGYDYCLHIIDIDSSQRLLTFVGEALSCWRCDWRPDNQLIAICSDDKVFIWSNQTLSVLKIIAIGSGFINGCQWSPDVSNILIFSTESYLCICDGLTYKLQQQWQPHKRHEYVAIWSPDSQKILTASYDKTLKIWHAPTGRLIKTLRGHVGSVDCCAWSEDGKYILSASSDQTLRVWDAHNYKEILVIRDSFGHVNKCEWSPDSKWISLACESGFYVWDFATRALHFQSKIIRVRECKWSNDGNRLLILCGFNTIEVWDIPNRKVIFALKDPFDSFSSCAWSPDCKQILSVSWYGMFKIWNVANAQCIWTGHHLLEDQAVAISGDQERVLWASLEAWRWLGWQVSDDKGRFLQRLPIEAFGPISGLKD